MFERRTASIRELLRVIFEYFLGQTGCVLDVTMIEKVAVVVTLFTHDDVDDDDVGPNWELIKYRKIILGSVLEGEVTLMETVLVSEIKRDYDWSLI